MLGALLSLHEIFQRYLSVVSASRTYARPIGFDNLSYQRRRVILTQEHRPDRHRLELDRELHDVRIDGIPLELGAREYAFLCAFVAFLKSKRRRSLGSLAELLRAYHVMDP